jgi:hypothetical protein
MPHENGIAIGEVVERVIDGVGLLRFENFGPGEWLTQKGEPAKVSRRRYLLDGDEYDSVSSIVDTLSKPGLYPWYENGGVRGGVKAQRMGELDDVPEEDWPERVRLLKLGASAQRDEGAERGTAVHVGLHTFATTGEPPNPADYPGVWHPWLQGSMRAALALGLSPDTLIEAEQIVCHPEHKYAGRFDLYAMLDTKRTLIDYKSGRGKIFDQGHYQTRGYAECFEPCGLEPPERILIVGIDDDGGFQIVECEAILLDWMALLHTFRSRKRINAGMAAQRKAARKAAA